MKSRLASIDIGTNTIRLLIADTDKKSKLHKVLTERRIARLGEDFIEKSEISFKAIERSIVILKEFINITKKYNVRKVITGATSAVRKAENKDEFLKKVYKETGLQVRVLSEREEATITFTGVLTVMDSAMGKTLVMDIGGGSTEFIIGEGNVPVSTYSLDLGAVYLTERFIRSDPPNPQELDNTREFVDKRLSSFKESVMSSQSGISFSSLIGTAGTITTLAAMDQKMSVYDPERINRYLITRESIMNIYTMLCGMTLEERSVLPGLEKGREDIIMTGTVIVLEVMKAFQFHEMMVSDHGLLEGLLRLS